VSSVSLETQPGPLTVLLEMKMHVLTTIMPPIDEAALWVKPLVADSHLEVPGSTAHNSMCDLYLTLEKVSLLVLRGLPLCIPLMNVLHSFITSNVKN